MNYGSLETEIAQRVQTLLTGTEYEVEVMPDNDDRFTRSVTKGRVSVWVPEVKTSEPSSTSMIRQLETIQVQLHIKAKNLRSTVQPLTFGVYEVADSITRILVGWMPTDCNRMYKVGLRFQSRENETWEYILTLATTTLLVEDYTEPVVPLITQITTTNDGDPLVVPIPE